MDCTIMYLEENNKVQRDWILKEDNIGNYLMSLYQTSWLHVVDSPCFQCGIFLSLNLKISMLFHVNLSLSSEHMLKNAIFILHLLKLLSLPSKNYLHEKCYQIYFSKTKIKNSNYKKKTSLTFNRSLLPHKRKSYYSEIIIFIC